MKKIIYTNYPGWIKEEELIEYALDMDYIEDREEATKGLLTSIQYQLEEEYFQNFRYESENFFDDNWIVYGTCGLWDGIHAAGKVCHSITDILAGLNDCTFIEFYEEEGKLFMNGSHHDGTNHFEIRRITAAGCKYIDSNWSENDREVHEKVISCSVYSRLPRYIDTVYGS